MCGIFRKLRKNNTITHISIIIILVITIVFAFSVSLSSCTESEDSSGSSSTPSTTSQKSAKLTTTRSQTTKPPAATTTTTTTVKPTTTTTAKPTTTTQKPTTTTQPTTTAEYNDFENEVLRLVNIERAKEGLSALLKGDAKIYAAAQVRAKEIKLLFSHTRPGNGNVQWYTVFEEYNIKYRNVGENLAKGHTSPKAVVEGWMNSPGHRENIMKQAYTHLSVALYKDNGINYWVQLFIAY